VLRNSQPTYNIMKLKQIRHTAILKEERIENLEFLYQKNYDYFNSVFYDEIERAHNLNLTEATLTFADKKCAEDPAMLDLIKNIIGLGYSIKKEYIKKESLAEDCAFFIVKWS